LKVASRNRHARLAGLIVVVAAACGIAGAAASLSTTPLSLSRLKPTPTPSGWRLLVPRSGTSSLWYPPVMRPASGDPWSVTAELRDGKGTILAYLNAGPKSGPERMKTWATFRLDHLRDEHSHSVREEDRAAGLTFRGGRGSCVMDDYLTRVAVNHYREIACLVQGRTTASVIIAAALVRVWPKYAPRLERALEAYQVR
jgi:hypothetical protein